MIKQGCWIYLFFPFNLIEKCANFFFENPRNMKGARYRMLLFVSEQIRSFKLFPYVRFYGYRFIFYN